MSKSSVASSRVVAAESPRPMRMPAAVRPSERLTTISRMPPTKFVPVRTTEEPTRPSEDDSEPMLGTGGGSVVKI